MFRHRDVDVGMDVTLSFGNSPLFGSTSFAGEYMSAVVNLHAKLGLPGMIIGV